MTWMKRSRLSQIKAHHHDRLLLKPLQRVVSTSGGILLICAAVVFLAACQSAAPTPFPTSAPPTSAAPTAAPAAFQTTPSAERYANLPQNTSDRGVPQLGFPSAPVPVVIYGAFDDPATLTFLREAYDALLTRARSSEIMLTYVPLHGRGDIPGGRGAARAAVCAGEQGAFWPYFDALRDLAAQFPDEPYTGDRLIDAANRLPLDRGRWDECMVSERPDLVLDTAANLINGEPNFNGTPFVTVGGVPTLPNLPALNSSIDIEMAEVEARLAAALATEEAATPDPNATEEPFVVTLEPLTGDQVPPPLEIDLPPGWSEGYDVLVLGDVDGVRTVPFALYTGPVTGGTGTIVLLWGFPNLANETQFDPAAAPALWTDGLRLLRLAILEVGCNIGTDLRRDYNVGELTGVGTEFSGVQCPELPDTRGWFVGLRQFSVNFVFYVYAEPIGAMDGARAELQAVLDSIRFVRPEVTPEATAETTPGT